MKQLPRLDEKQRLILAAFIVSSKRSGKEVRRAQSVQLVDSGEHDKVTLFTGISKRQAFTNRSKYLTKGVQALLDRAKGKPKRLLTGKQRKGVVKILKEKSPEDFGYGKQPGWSTGMLGAVIEREYGVIYKSKTSLYLLFKESKLSYHLPVKHYERRSKEEVEVWEKETTPILKKAWKDKNTVILAEDEMSLSSQTTIQKAWLPQGENVEITISKKRESRSLYGFLNLKTGTEHAFKTPWQNMFLTVEQLTKIREIYPTKHLLIIWDQAGWHKGSEVTKWIEEDKNTETIYFPAAAPDQNPQEHVWKAGRAAVTHNQFIPKIDDAADSLVSHINETIFAYELLGFRASILDAVS